MSRVYLFDIGLSWRAGDYYRNESGVNNEALRYKSQTICLILFDYV